MQRIGHGPKERARGRHSDAQRADARGPGKRVAELTTEHFAEGSCIEVAAWAPCVVKFSL